MELRSQPQVARVVGLQSTPTAPAISLRISFLRIGRVFGAAVSFGYLLNEQPCVFAPIGIFDVVFADRLHKCLAYSIEVEKRKTLAVLTGHRMPGITYILIEPNS